MFDTCESLTNLNLSSFDTSKVTDMNRMFFNCSKLITIKGVLDLSSCTDVDDMFCNCSVTGLHLKNVPRELDFSKSRGIEGKTYVVDNYID